MAQPGGINGMIAACVASPQGQQLIRRYLASPEGQKAIDGYLATPEGQKMIDGYLATPEGQRMACLLLGRILDRIDLPADMRTAIRKVLDDKR